MPQKRGAEDQEPINVDSGSDIESVKAPFKAKSTRTSKKSWVWHPRLYPKSNGRRDPRRTYLPERLACRRHDQCR
ncbi:uncharacterized protein PGTG_20952 [Puccinia graminis f. sp. tritici CRL 75-36-700-3]|uniref:Uncharacterized protein n=1 Tax=Puccinia graminis f. sp. tritici (strain CRL 75-36-700-3 / race SCCL) TaxID=418459 RepID=H6QQ06_PUCGT|nr:uncharacterized protein PGTG_20952 [Puccinia graminis f. sp. tritici CRL 75-36-700-3]EHS64489.1 hypothetical protein PGTG_20952 [Puccinia graminis f. sp. tritici CRL 75-36-700-3]